MKKIKQCKVTGCIQKAYCRGFCTTHYMRWKTHGDALIKNKFQQDIPLEERFWSKVDMRNPFECWPWLAALRRKDEGYGAFWINGRHQPASRIAYILIFNDVPVDIQVCHKCDNPNCCNPEHLFVGTNVDNARDRDNKGRGAVGEKRRTSTWHFCKTAVMFIRRLIKNKALKQIEVAKMFNVHRSVINNLIKGRTYAHYY